MTGINFTNPESAKAMGERRPQDKLSRIREWGFMNRLAKVVIGLFLTMIVSSCELLRLYSTAISNKHDPTMTSQELAKQHKMVEPAGRGEKFNNATN